MSKMSTGENPYRQAAEMLEMSNSKSRRDHCSARIKAIGEILLLAGCSGLVSFCIAYRSNHIIKYETKEVVKEVPKIEIREVVKEVPKIEIREVVKEVLPPSVCTDQFTTKEWVVGEEYKCKHPLQKMEAVHFGTSGPAYIDIKCSCR